MEDVSAVTMAPVLSSRKTIEYMTYAKSHNASLWHRSPCLSYAIQSLPANLRTARPSSPVQLPLLWMRIEIGFPTMLLLDPDFPVDALE